MATSIDDAAPFDYARPVAAALIDQAISRPRCLKPAASRRNLRCPV
jgi:hypothetical protein